MDVGVDNWQSLPQTRFRVQACLEAAPIQNL